MMTCEDEGTVVVMKHVILHFVLHCSKPCKGILAYLKHLFRLSGYVWHFSG